MKILNCLAITLSLQVIILCIAVSLRFVSIQSTVTLLIFTAFFSSVTFLLNGTSTKKLLLLALGNATGLLWNFAFDTFTNLAVTNFGNFFETFYLVSYPFVNALWVVSFWSLSLATFRYQPLNHEKRKRI